MFTLQILHASDLEGGVDAIANAPNFAAIVDALEAEAEAAGYGSILLSAGDNYIPGPFFNAAQFVGDDIFVDTYSALFADDLAANPDIVLDVGDGRGNADIAIANILGIDASAVGNHEFDNGPDAFAGLITPAVDGTTIESFGALFPYLSANLDFSGEPALADLVTDEIRPAADYAQTPSQLAAGEGSDAEIAASTIVEVDGEQVGILGATYQIVSTVSSTGGVVDETGGENDMALLAENLQPDVDALIAAGVNKVVLVTHLQDFNREVELAGLLEGVDVIIAGGSDTISADEQDTLRTGDEAQQPYPFVATGADGNPVAIVSTDGEYSYVGRLVIDFDENGVIVPESVDAEVSGAFATDEAGLLATTGAASVEDAIAGSEKATLVSGLTDAVQTQVTESDGTVFGQTGVYLDGRRETVRTEESNLGNLTADANIVAARTVDPDVIVSIKNGGGIRAAIGEIDGETGELLPTQANPVSGKDEGEVSELDIQNALRFNNGLVVVDLSTADLKIILEHAVASSGPGSTPGQFFQVGGLRVSVDLEGTAQELDDTGAVTTEGTRIQNVALIDEDGNTTQVIIENGEVVEGAPESIKTVTLNFLAGDDGDLVGGDGYPFRALSPTVVDTEIGEQQALQDFLAANFPEDGDAAFSEPELAASLDRRIQILDNGGSDTVLAPVPTGEIEASLVFSYQGESDPEDEDSPEGASEVVSYVDGTLYTTNGNLDRIDVVDAATGELTGSIDLSGLPSYAGVQSVAASEDVVVAVVDTTLFSTPENGIAAIYDRETLELLSTATLGNLPDSIAISPDGLTAVVANEGEFNGESDVTIDARGSVSIIDLSDPAAPTVERVGFSDVDASNLRIREGVSPEFDIEPEYTTFTPDGTLAIVSLQENNGLAVIDVASASLVALVDSGLVDHSQEGFGFDATDDDVIDILPRNTVGMRMPDAIATYEANGAVYILGANEGDGRGDITEGDEGVNVEDADEARVEDLIELGLIDESVDTAGLERLTVSTVDGDTDGDGDIDVLHSFGSRSFTIWDTEGNVIFDSGDQFESIIANLAPERFNDDDGELGQNRSDAKGPEPEAIAVGEISGRTYAFIGAERDSGIFVYDVTEPANSRYVTYLDGFESGNLGPETIAFIPAAESATGQAQIAVSYEITGTTAVYDLALDADEAATEEFYLAALGRTSDVAGRDFWSDLLEDASIEFLAEAFDLSNEFQVLIDGLTDLEGLNLVFNNALGRDATEEEQAEFLPGIAEEGYDQVLASLVDNFDFA